MGIGNRHQGTVLAARLGLITPHGDRKLAANFARRRSGQSSLPLMGIGNSNERGTTDKFTGLAHYPSWGSETVLDRDGQNVIGNSLPLMGIGNGQVFQAVGRRNVLITPHGDRKPAPRRIRCATRRTHYPSWGSETTWQPPSAHTEATSHYPSWGSETGRAKRISRTRWSSLPLMGIGNKVTHHGAEPGFILITPHGDRKPAATASTQVSPSTSLPLMGIGNGRESARNISDRDASLPLMGIGNAARIASAAVRIGAHYPSWGSETSYGARCPRTISSSLPLMGIGNGRTGGKRMPAVATHYPSWGSETGRYRVRRVNCNCSLPLMGIGNATSSRPSRSICNVSLPLMGIGNRYAIRRIPLLPVPHYPSWGSETSEPSGKSTSSTTSSLPLMGIGNARGRSGLGPVWSPHYPSWGSET